MFDFFDSDFLDDVSTIGGYFMAILGIIVCILGVISIFVHIFSC